MAKTKKTKKRIAQPQSQPLDSIFLLKIVMYLILGSQWIRFVDANGSGQIPLPIGLMIGLLFAVHDHFQIDRKIEFAVLLVAMFVGFWSQIGIYITV